MLKSVNALVLFALSIVFSLEYSIQPLVACIHVFYRRPHDLEEFVFGISCLPSCRSLNAAKGYDYFSGLRIVVPISPYLSVFIGVSGLLEQQRIRELAKK